MAFCVSYEFSLRIDQLMQLKYVREDQRYERLTSFRISHSPYIMESLITGNTHAPLFIPVILFSISLLYKYVPHTLLGFFPEHTQKATFENLTSLHNVVLMLLFLCAYQFLTLLFGQEC